MLFKRLLLVYNLDDPGSRNSMTSYFEITTNGNVKNQTQTNKNRMDQKGGAWHKMTFQRI